MIQSSITNYANICGRRPEEGEEREEEEGEEEGETEITFV